MRIFLTVVFAAFAGFAQQGRLVVDGKQYTVVAGCAYEEGSRTVVLLWTDASTPATPDCRNLGFTLQRKVREGGTPFLTVNLDSPGMEWTSGAITNGENTLSFSYSGTDPVTIFEKATGSTAAGVLKGRLYTARELSMTNFPKLLVDVNLQLTPEKQAPVSNGVTGEEAAKTAPARAARVMLEAMSKGDMKTVRSMIVEAERARFDQDLASPDKAAILKMMSGMAKDTLTMPVTSVNARGDITEVKFERKTENGKESSTFKMVQEGGVWRMTEKR